MTARITADWLHEPALQAVFDALETDGDTARVVGGAVRNTLLGLPATDIDISTTAGRAVIEVKNDLIPAIPFPGKKKSDWQIPFLKWL